MKYSDIFRAAAKIVDRKYSRTINGYEGCCRAIGQLPALKEPCYTGFCSNLKFNILYRSDAQTISGLDQDYYFGPLTPENILTRQLALLFAAEYYEDLGV